ncbi:aromatic acid exporter family protein [Streptococcus plurextorum]|uniref:aromatic acid exporter family protein n=1 Tax=Streptococcus plurextorum TaxID=456876 RepID=UPI00048823CB|nr:aromatic acid exporter family protein [Streptococcus plurextorum]
MSLFQRTIKLTVATVLAIWLADVFGLAYTSSAGIIAILSVLDTRRSSIKIAKQRFLSALLALGIASSLFALLGFHLPVIALYLACYVPLAYRFQLEAGIAPITVLVLHLYMEQSIAPSWLVNELLLFMVGASVALLLNLYMPSKESEIASYHIQVEEKLKAILHRFEGFLLSGDGSNEAVLIGQLDDLLTEAKRLVYLDHNNQLFQQTNYQVHYFDMRQEQSKLLRQMALNVNSCHLGSRESVILAHLFHETAQQLSQENPAKTLLEDIADFRELFRQRPLPKTRDEFETRAVLFQLLNDLERFIQFKVDFYNLYQDH